MFQTEQNNSFFSITECGPLVDPEDGSVSTTGVVFESEATYSCNTGFYLKGTDTAVCTADREWSPEPPTCKRNSKYCLCIDFLVKNHLNVLELLRVLTDQGPVVQSIVSLKTLIGRFVYCFSINFVSR